MFQSVYIRLKGYDLSLFLGHSVGDASGRLLSVDQKVCEYLGRSQKELLGMTYCEITHSDDRSRNITLINSLCDGAGPLSIKKRYLRPDGTYTWSSVQVSRLGGSDAGKLVGTIRMLDPSEGPGGPRNRWQSARLALAHIARRRIELGENFFADYPYLILLEIYLAEAEARLFPFIELYQKVGTEAVLVKRWIRALESAGYLEPFSSELVYPQLSKIGVEKTERILDSMTPLHSAIA